MHANAREKACVISMAPSNGFAVVTTDTSWSYVPFAGSSEERRRLLASVSCIAYGLPVNAELSDEEQAVADNLACTFRSYAVDGSVARQARARRLSPSRIAPREGLDFGHLRESGLRFSSSHVAWDKVGAALDSGEIEIRPRRLRGDGNGGDGRVGVINWSSPVCVYEAVHPQFGIVGEGSSPVSDRAKAIAMAEAIERLLAGSVPAVALSVATGDELRQQSFEIPPFQVGIRDGYSDDLLTTWLPGWTLDGHPAALPSDIVAFPGTGISHFRLFWKSCG